MVVIVDVLNPLWIKHVSPQHSYNNDCLPALQGCHLLGCTPIVTASPVIMGLSANLQLQQG